MFNKNIMATLRRKEDGLSGSHSSPIRLTYAEDALRTMSLHEGAKTTSLCWMRFIILYISIDNKLKIEKNLLEKKVFIILKR